jgi:lipid A ethanolaminephosphotransferase
MPAARNPLTLAVGLALWLAVPGNWPLWRALAELPELASARGALFGISLAAMIAGLNLALLSLAAWRRCIKPVGALLLLLAALGAHYMGRYRIVIDPTMLVNVLQTDPGEAADLIGPGLLASLLLLAGLPAWWLWRTPLHTPQPGTQALRIGATLMAALCLAGGLLLLNFAPMSATMRNHKALRYMVNPANSVYALGRVAFKAGARPAGPPVVIGTDAVLLSRRAGAKPPLLMLVVGETARADHFALNGYARETNPYTAGLGVVSFGNVSACGTSTAASWPCMFSPLGRDAFVARRGEQENLLDLLQRAGLAVLWLDNQVGCKGLCARVPHAMAAAAPPGSKHAPGLCRDGECLDEAMLTGLEQRLDALPPERRARGVVLVLHQMGSHGPAYYRRSPADGKRFLPECTTHALQDCAPQALVNAYDNSIAYTDRMLARSIRWLQAQGGGYDPMLLYVSDHGESLGEHNLYLHGMPLAVAPREQTHVPMLLWLPPQSQTATGAPRECLLQRRDAALSHDHLFHTVLGLLGVASSLHDPALDLTAACRGV